LPRARETGTADHIAHRRSDLSEGEPGDAFYVLVQGLVRVTIADRFIRNLQLGDSFGEIAC
jgi:CRP-like cAMP-binding protein